MRQYALSIPTRLTIEPITVKAAISIVKQWHRHLPNVQGGLFAAACAVQSRLKALVVSAADIAEKHITNDNSALTDESLARLAAIRAEAERSGT